jgi:hypothetical protein
MCSATGYPVADRLTYTHREIDYSAIVPSLGGRCGVPLIRDRDTQWQSCLSNVLAQYRKSTLTSSLTRFSEICCNRKAPRRL